MGAEAYFKQYWQPYLKVVTYCDLYSTCGYKNNQPFKSANNIDSGSAFKKEDSRTAFYTPDGLLYNIFIGTRLGYGFTANNLIMLDINGGELPNKFGRDVFLLERIEDGGGVRPYGYKMTDNEIDEDCSKSGIGNYCAEKIRRAGWRIEKDYPW